MARATAPQPVSPARGDRSVGRRKFLAGLLGGVAVAAFHPGKRRWLGAADAQAGDGFPTPALDGTLTFDPAARAADSTDEGNLVTHVPAAVLRPGSVNDIVTMVRYCRRFGLQVAARGQHHTMFGQGLTTGLLIEMSSLATIHTIAADHVVADAGIMWRDLLAATLAEGLRPPTLTGYLGLTLGGTLSVGGCPLTNDKGALVDHVREMVVVTGEGELVTCSMTQNRRLFEAVLAGLGQCAIICRVTFDLVPAHSTARTYSIPYSDTAVFFRDMRTLAGRAELDEVYTICAQPGTAPFTYLINATIFFDPSSPPDDAHLLRGLAVPAAVVPHQDTAYFDYATSVDAQIGFLQATFGWDKLQKPWFDQWLPDAAVESFVGGSLGSLTAEDVGPFGFLLLFAQRRSKMTRPFLRLPDDTNGSDWIWLFDIATTSAGAAPDAAFVDRMLTRNRRLFEQARALGGTRYPIGATPFTTADWRQQYGRSWGAFVSAKHEFDPSNILAPGPGIFAARDDD